MSDDPDFERSLSFDELLPARALERAGRALDAMLGTPVHISDATGDTRYGTPPDAADVTSMPLNHDLETVGALAAAVPPARLRPAAELLHTLMHANARYAMAASLHFQTIESSYVELQRQHAELQASEARYRELATSLEQRVLEQIGTIEEAQRQLYQAEKLASVGQLAAGVAHEINNPLGFMLSNLRSARDYLHDISGIQRPCRAGDIDAVQHYWRQENLDFVLEDFATLLQETQDGAERVARIVSSLKDFSSIDHGGATSVDLDAALVTVCDVATPKINPRAELIFQPGAPPPIPGDPAKINQALLNLLLNAAEAMPAGRRGHIRIRTSHTGHWARVDIGDDAGGIPAEVLPRIFDPFFTTHGVGQGTGLGLTVVRDIINAHHGRLEVDSHPGEGTTFSLFLPMDAEAAHD
ncbi:MAG: HAMP domain-containing histidine kinase [Rhodocyclales bacterium]|nr:HAMP domain-containing histidine kinase [Rhodocyclales bacterium]